MQFTIAFIASAAALTASALPQTTPIATGDAFGVITIRSGSPVQNSAIQAAHNGLLVNAKSQNASCDAASNFATFYINEEKEMHLLESKTSYRTQTVYVDQSGMGQGLIGYLTGAQPLPRNGQKQGWEIVDGELKFLGTGLQACPGSIDGGWSLWLQGLDKPGFLDNCTSMYQYGFSSEHY